jgi:hypothetical protein
MRPIHCRRSSWSAPGAPVLGLVVAVLLGAALRGQAPDRRVLSPEGRSMTEIAGRVDERLGTSGGKRIQIIYGRPLKRGRDLFGADDFVEFLNDGAPVWRAGANVSTRLLTETALQFGRTIVPPGEYTIFIELSRERWTFIVSTWRAQTTGYDPNDKTALYGAFDYTPDKDLVRVPMTLETLPHSQEQLHWEFLDMTATGGRLVIMWDRRMASVPFSVAK